VPLFFPPVGGFSAAGLPVTLRLCSVRLLISFSRARRSRTPLFSILSSPCVSASGFHSSPRFSGRRTSSHSLRSDCLCATGPRLLFTPLFDLNFHFRALFSAHPHKWCYWSTALTPACLGPWFLEFLERSFDLFRTLFVRKAAG